MIWLMQRSDGLTYCEGQRVLATIHGGEVAIVITYGNNNIVQGKKNIREHCRRKLL
jgi:hypothetical protein